MEPRSASLVAAKVQVIPTQCEGVVMDRLESPLGVASSLIEPSPETPAPDRLYIAWSEGPERYPSRPEAHKRITLARRADDPTRC
jgi:hypothetical protein